MKRIHWWTALMTLAILLVSQFVGPIVIQAQRSAPLVVILGKPDSTSSPPDVHAKVSVVDPSTGRFMEGLSDENFSVRLSGDDISATTSPETTGLAVIIVIDRGGIGQSTRRIGWAVDLTESLLDMLNVDGSETADMVGLIGIRGRDWAEAEGLEDNLVPRVPLTDFDPNAVRNHFDTLRNEVVREVTPLYDGIDQAIEWLSENPDSQIQDKLEHRRKMIVVFSDGIDNRFSDKSHEALITSNCRENDILLYAVRIGGGTTDADNLEALASDTKGRYITHDSETSEEAHNLFQEIVTQRQAYRVTFPLLAQKGDYDVTIQVDTSIGAGRDEARVSSRLQATTLTLTSPSDGLRLTVPYSRTVEGFLPSSVDMSVQVAAVEGAERMPQEVNYFANGVKIGASTTPPNFPFTWQVSREVTPTEEMQSADYTLVAHAKDAYLGTDMASPSVNIHVTWEAKEVTVVEKVTDEGKENWWIILVLVGLLVGLLVLVLLMRRMQGRLENTAVGRAATGILRKTKLLGPMTPAHGKLVIIQGANMGREFRLAAPMLKVGRDPQFADLALQDEFISNPHFSIQMEQGQYYVTDEGSSNGTRLNGTPLQPNQRMLLQPDAIIEVGQTKLQFKRLGGPTQPLNSQEGADLTAAGPAPQSQPSSSGSAMVQGPPHSAS